MSLETIFAVVGALDFPGLPRYCKELHHVGNIKTSGIGLLRIVLTVFLNLHRSRNIPLPSLLSNVVFV